MQPDTVIPDLYNPQLLNRYSYAINNPIRYNDPDGHCPICIAAVAVTLKVIDYGWTGYDIFQAGRVYLDDDSTEQAKQDAARAIGTAIAFELLEPDDLTPGLPIDDIVRHGDDIVKLVGHHTIPRQILKKLPPDIADAVRGKKGDPNIWDIPEAIHKQIHRGPGGPGGAYNRRWREELAKLQEVTVTKIKTIRDELVEEFGLEKWKPK